MSSREAAKAGGRERPVQGVPELQSPRTDAQAAGELVTQLGFQGDRRRPHPSHRNLLFHHQQDQGQRVWPSGGDTVITALRRQKQEV